MTLRTSSCSIHPAPPLWSLCNTQQHMSSFVNVFQARRTRLLTCSHWVCSFNLCLHRQLIDYIVEHSLFCLFKKKKNRPTIWNLHVVFWLPDSLDRRSSTCSVKNIFFSHLFSLNVRPIFKQTKSVSSWKWTTAHVLRMQSETVGLEDLSQRCFCI